jgi:HEAT repeat protein
MQERVTKYGFTHCVSGKKRGTEMTFLRNFMNPLSSLLLAACIAAASLRAAEPVMDVYVSTGDNHYLGSSLPIDSPASIEATFNLFKDVNHARRVYWRGLEASCWLATMHARAENPRYFSFFDWLREIYASVSPDTLAVRAAHARGMEIWGMGSLFDWGSQMDTPGFNDYPFAFESTLRLAHPEWAPVDKRGTRRQGGPIELAYPEARKALVDLTVKETLKAGYDGICFLTYVENYSLRFQDEFGFSDPIVADFKRLYKADLRTEPFKRGASREDWLRLRGSYVTAFLRELKAELDKHGVKLGVVVNSNEARLPQSWNVPELVLTAGAVHMDVDTWVRDGLVDELLVYGNNSGPSQMKTLDDLTFLARGTKTRVSAMTSGPFREGWKPYQDAGMVTILAVNEDAQHIERGFVPEQKADAIKSADTSLRMRALQQSITGNLKLDSAAVVELANSPNMIERRLALQTLGKIPDAPLDPLLAGLRDPENGVRCIAALALAQRKDATACAALLEAAEAHGNHMLRECVVIALRRLAPLPAAELGDAALHSKSDKVREVAMRALAVNPTAAMLPMFREALKDTTRFPRFAAAEALGNLAKNAEAIEMLIEALNHDDSVVANRAAVSLAQLAVLKNPASEASRPKILAALVTAFKKHSDATRDDAEWGWRPIGNALLDLGDKGAAALCAIRDQRENARLAELAWRVVDLTQRKATFSEVSAEADAAAHARRPPETAGQTSRADLHVDPAKGNDANDGRTAPVKTIARAIKLAQSGDTVHLTPGTYFESADLSNKHGEDGRPITLDGHGSVLDGSEPVRAADWESLGHDLYRKVKLLPRMDEAIRVRWFFVWDCKMNRMGLCSKGPSLPLKKPDELKAGEWTYVQSEDAFYLKLPKGQSLDAANIRYPARSSAVIESGRGSWLTVRNVTGTHVYNDGYNIHGAQRHTVFENIAAIDCGDDGFSAHEDADCRIDGFISIGNATGLCDTGTSQTHYRNVFIRGCHGFDLYFIGLTHSIENAVIESSAARAFMLDGAHLKDGNVCNLRLKNVLLRRVGGGTQELRIGNGGRLRAERCTFLNLNVTMTPGAAIDLQQCLLGGDPTPDVLLSANTIWRGDGNLYDFKSLRAGKETFRQETFADFQKFTGSESKSRWETTPHAPTGIGADESALKAIKRN